MKAYESLQKSFARVERQTTTNGFVVEYEGGSKKGIVDIYAIWRIAASYQQAKKNHIRIKLKIYETAKL